MPLDNHNSSQRVVELKELRLQYYRVLRNRYLFAPRVVGRGAGSIARDDGSAKCEGSFDVGRSYHGGQASAPRQINYQSTEVTVE